MVAGIFEFMHYTGTLSHVSKYSIIYQYSIGSDHPVFFSESFSEVLSLKTSFSTFTRDTCLLVTIQQRNTYTLHHIKIYLDTIDVFKWIPYNSGTGILEFEVEKK